MNKLRKGLDFFFTYIMTFALFFYLGGPEISMAVTFVLLLGILLLFFTIVEDLRNARGPVFTLLSVVAVSTSVAKLTASFFICGWIPGIFAMLLYVHLMRTFVWLVPNKKATEEE